MIETIIKTLLSLVVSGVFGYLIGRIKNYKEKVQQKENEYILLKEALMTMLQSNLTNTYYLYEPQKRTTDYIYRNWLNSFSMYEKLGGNDYVHVLADKMKDWDFTKTDILK